MKHTQPSSKPRTLNRLPRSLWILSIPALLAMTSAFLGLAHAEDCSTWPIAAVNPTPINNPKGAAFPGNRGGNQLVIYTADHDNSTTQTNEYGAELRISNGRVVDITGSNSDITKDAPILSAHGSAAKWLLKWGQVGNTVTLDLPKQVSICIPPDTNRYQTLKRIEWATEHPNLKAQLPANAESLDPTELENHLAPHVAPFPESSIKGVWHRPVAKNSSVAAITKALSDFKAKGLNTVFLETYLHGWTLYPSKVYAEYGLDHTAYPNLGVVNGEPLLARWVRLAHEQGMQVHAWVQVFYVGNEALGQPSPVLKHYPEWANRQRETADNPTPRASNVEHGHWFMDPANREVRAFVVKLIDELAMNYAVDGIELDYIRYPAPLEKTDDNYMGSTWGYTPAARHKFEKLYGVDPVTIERWDTPMWETWQRFKADQVSHIVSTLRDHQQSSWKTARTLKEYPALQLSASVFPDTDGPYSKKHQDWPLWIRQGELDFITPMVLSPNVTPVCKSIQTMQDISDTPVVVGLFSPFYKAGNFALLQQTQAAYTCGAEGYSLFSSSGI